MLSTRDKFPPVLENSPPKASVPEVIEIVPPLKLTDFSIETVPPVEEISPALMLTPFFKSRFEPPIISFWFGSSNWSSPCISSSVSAVPKVSEDWFSSKELIEILESLVRKYLSANRDWRMLYRLLIEALYHSAIGVKLNP